MVNGMATVKLTITLDQDQLKDIQRLVHEGSAGSVSGFVKHAVKNALLDSTGWQSMLDQALAETGGPLKDNERAWADEILDGSKKRKFRKKPAA